MRSLLLLSLLTGTSEPRTFDLLTARVEDIQAAVDAGALTYERLVEMCRHPADALVHPFKSLAAPPLGEDDRGLRDNPVRAITGLPAVVVPAGVTSEGLPISIEFLGRPFSERTLLAIAHAYERSSQKRVAPKSTPYLPGEVFTYE